MAKQPNVVPTQKITIATTPKVVRLLTYLAMKQLHGKNIAEVAERLVTAQLLEYEEKGKIPRELFD